MSVFRRHGYQGASMSELANATGLGKSSLYHHFPGGKDDMALAVLDHVRQWLDEHVVKIAAGDGTPKAKLAAITERLAAFYENGREPCLLGALAAGGARANLQAPLREAFQMLIAAFTALGIEGGAPKAKARLAAEDAVLRIQGALILSAGLDDPSPFRHVLERLPKDILG